MVPSHEDEQQRVNRELIELLNELRVALPGVQVLLAFLLAMPFQQRFGQVTSLERNLYFFTLCCTLLATGLLVAPSAYHRLNFRMREKQRILLVSNSFAIAGIVVLGLALVGVMTLVSEFVFGDAAAIAFGAASALVLGALWVGLPLRQRRRGLTRGNVDRLPSR